MAEIAGLIAKLEALDGPSREVDAEIDAALRIGKANMERWAWDNFPVWRAAQQIGMCEVVHDNGAGGLVWNSQPFTASIDAAVALVERCLKTYSLDITIDPSGNGAKINWWPSGLSGGVELGPYKGVSVSPELAILLALLRAMEGDKP